MAPEPFDGRIPDCTSDCSQVPDGLTFTFQQPFRAKVRVSGSHFWEAGEEKEILMTGLTGGCPECRQKYADSLTRAPMSAVSLSYTSPEKESDDERTGD